MTFPPPGQLPPPDPTAPPPSGSPVPQPTQIDPYAGAPGYISDAPVTSVPMSVYKAPPPMPPGPPPTRNTGWIVGGVAGIALLVVALVVTLIATGVFAGDPVPQANDSADETSPAETSSSSPDEPAAPGGRYGFVESLCTDITVDPYLDGMTAGAPLDLTSEIGDNGLMNCGYSMSGSGVGFSYAYLSIAANTFADEASAQQSHPSQKEFSLVTGDPVSLDGPWQQGEIIVVEEPQYDEVEVAVFVLDGNLSLRVELTTTNTPYTDTQAMVVGTVKEIMGLLAN